MPDDAKGNNHKGHKGARKKNYGLLLIKHHDSGRPISQ